MDPIPVAASDLSRTEQDETAHRVTGVASVRLHAPTPSDDACGFAVVATPAADQGGAAIGVVLSGARTAGALGNDPATRTRPRATTAELVSTSGDLRSSNEQFRSSNEDLRSSRDARAATSDERPRRTTQLGTGNDRDALNAPDRGHAIRDVVRRSAASVEHPVRGVDGAGPTSRIAPYLTADHAISGATIEVVGAASPRSGGSDAGHEPAQAAVAAPPQALMMVDEGVRGTIRGTRLSQVSLAPDPSSLVGRSKAPGAARRNRRGSGRRSPERRSAGVRFATSAGGSAGGTPAGTIVAGIGVSLASDGEPRGAGVRAD
jgi:hypothetical protein